jgi:hypothetical protein
MEQTPKNAEETPLFPKTLHRVRVRPPEVPTPSPTAEKHDNVQSRDLREDRGERQMKTTHNPQTFPHGH